MIQSRFGVVFISIIFFVSAWPSPVRAAPAVDPKLLAGLPWRSIGPAVFGGRVTDVAGLPGDRNVLYVAHASAGLFKSTNGGITFESIFDEGHTLSIGAIALAPENPEVIYAGTGEGNPRNSTSFGDGLYKSLDGGKTWKHLGLEATERFSRIIVNPLNPDIVFAGAMGHEWGANEERGVYRSKDAGATWEKVLYTNETSGCSDLRFDPENPNIVYAGMYDYQRRPWHFRSGGPGSGLYRSSDGGDTWVKLTDPALENGLPGKGLLGRIGMGVARSNPRVVYAMIESEEEGELWRSEDRGKSWKMVNADSSINFRPFYFTDIRVDPMDENRIYSLSGPLLLSTDGGKTFDRIGRTIHGDHQALWIDPTDPQRVLNGSDGGFHVSNDRGAHWELVNVMPLAQAYHVNYDMADPYNVLAGFQDNHIWRGPNEKWNQAGVEGADWHRIHFGDGYYAEPDPRDPNVIYTNAHYGNIVRVDLRSGERRSIQPYPVALRGSPADLHPYRFNWNSPIHLSPNDPDVVYFGSNVLFRTRDGGYSWDIISPDLTTNDAEKITGSGGPITPDNTSAEYHCTIIAIAESPLDGRVIWVGTDDGNVQLTRDGGATWTHLTGNVKGLPPLSWVPTIHASHHAAGTAYVAFDRHRLDDFAPYAYVTTDYGKSWVKISDGLRGYVHVVRDDPRRPNLLYAGTELGIFVSFDGGKAWTDLRGDLPRLAVRDLKVHPRDNDLIIGTHGRGVYIMDDVTPLQELAEVMGEPVALFKPMTATRYVPAGDTGNLGDQVFLGPNQPYGATISYYLAEAPDKEDEEDKVQVEILDGEGGTLRKLEGEKKAGINRVQWNLREEPPGGVKPAKEARAFFFSPLDGPRVLPGSYRVRVTAREHTVEESFDVRLDPRLSTRREDLVAQYEAVRRMVGLEHETDEALEQIRSVLEQTASLEKRLEKEELQGELASIRKKLSSIQDELRADPGGYRSPARLKERISQLRRAIDGHTSPPTRAQSEWMERFEQDLDKVLDQLGQVMEEDLARLNRKLHEAGVPHILAGKGKSSAPEKGERS
ncbi:MAG: hypothetical protein ACE5JI_06115 [Acidobacteriota bacterium]